MEVFFLRADHWDSIRHYKDKTRQCVNFFYLESRLPKMDDVRSSELSLSFLLLCGSFQVDPESWKCWLLAWAFSIKLQTPSLGSGINNPAVGNLHQNPDVWSAPGIKRRSLQIQMIEAVCLLLLSWVSCVESQWPGSRNWRPVDELVLILGTDVKYFRRRAGFRTLPVCWSCERHEVLWGFSVGSVGSWMNSGFIVGSWCDGSWIESDRILMRNSKNRGNMLSRSNIVPLALLDFLH